jgi:hypothetical protein
MPVNPLNVRQQFLTTDVLRLEVEQRPASPAFGTVNLIRNTDAALGAWWWEADSPDAFVHTYTDPATKLPALQYEHGSSGTAALRSGLMPVKAGVTWATLLLDLVQLDAGMTVDFTYVYYTAARAVSSTSSVLLTRTGTGTALGGLGTSRSVPVDAAYVQLVATLRVTAGGTVPFGTKYAMRRIMVTPSDANPYAGGATPALSFVAPYAFRNILSGAHEITIERATLDVQTLTATIVDPLLDPAVDVAEQLAIGRRCQVTAYVETLGTWEPLFTGTVRDLRTDYVLDKDNPGSRRPRVTLVATDAIADLANTPQLEGTSNPLLLTTYMRGTGVPWRFAASSAYGYPGEWDSLNSSAKLIDQIAICRDSLGYGGADLPDADPRPGHAWADRRGVMQLWKIPPAERSYVGFMPSLVNAKPAASSNVTVATSAAAVTRYTGASATVYTATATAAGTMVVADATTFPFVDVEPGRSLDVSVWVRAASTARSATLSVEFEGEFAGILSTVTLATATDTSAANNGWVKLAGRVEVPPNARYARRKVSWAGCAAGEVHQVDELRTDPVRITYTANATDATASAFGDSYTELKVDWSTGTVVNAVTVNYLRLDPALGADSAPITYGPWVDQDSAERWGARSVTLTVQGAGESYAKVQAVAKALLAANGKPQRTARSMTVAVQNAAGIRHAVFVDLCDVIGLDYRGLVTAAPRVATLTHRITPEAWLVDYEFVAAGTLPLPQVTPAPGTNSSTPAPVSGFVSPTLSAGAGGTVKYTVRAGMVYVYLLCTFASAGPGVGRTVVDAGGIPAELRPPADMGTAYGQWTNGTVVGRVDVGTNGSISCVPLTGTTTGAVGYVVYPIAAG